MNPSQGGGHTQFEGVGGASTSFSIKTTKERLNKPMFHFLVESTFDGQEKNVKFEPLEAIAY